jgi:hypothetical protein
MSAPPCSGPAPVSHGRGAVIVDTGYPAGGAVCVAGSRDAGRDAVVRGVCHGRLLALAPSGRGVRWSTREDPCRGCPRASSSGCLPGGRAVVRLAPLGPQRWRSLAAGDVITMPEQRPVAGTATVVESAFPLTTCDGVTAGGSSHVSASPGFFEHSAWRWAFDRRHEGRCDIPRRMHPAPSGTGGRPASDVRPANRRSRPALTP